MVRFFKTIAHEGRLLILCHLLSGEKTVGDLEQLLGVRQANVSQQLARLRQERFITSRRDGKLVHYRLAGPRVEAMVAHLRELAQHHAAIIDDGPSNAKEPDPDAGSPTLQAAQQPKDHNGTGRGVRKDGQTPSAPLLNGHAEGERLAVAHPLAEFRSHLPLACEARC